MAGEESKSNPFSLFDKLFANRSREEKTSDSGVGVDRLQMQKMDERREAAQEKGYILGARPRGRSRPNRSRVIRGHHENPGAE